MCFDYYMITTTFAQRVNNRCDKNGQYKFQVVVDTKVARDVYGDIVVFKANDEDHAVRIFNQLNSIRKFKY